MTFSPFRIQFFIGEGRNSLSLISLFEKEGFKIQKCDIQSRENDWKFKFSPDIIILMPGKSQVSGSDIKSISQSLDGSSDLPFIVVSETSDLKEASQYFNLGALDYLSLTKDNDFLLTFFRARLSTVRRLQEKDRLINRLLETNNQLEVLAEKLREKIETHPYFYNNKEIKVTANFGIAKFDEMSEIEQCIQVADARLYHAKNSGRNKGRH